MTKPNPYLWPQKARLTFYNGRGRLLWGSCDRRLDLSDNLMGFWHKPSRTVYLGMSTASDRWSQWDEKTIGRMEELIRYDLGFDGYAVVIKRLTESTQLRCAEEFRWKLRIRPR